MSKLKNYWTDFNISFTNEKLHYPEVTDYIPSRYDDEEGMGRGKHDEKSMYMILGLVRACSFRKRLFILLILLVCGLSIAGLIRRFQAADATIRGIKNLKPTIAQNIEDIRLNNKRVHKAGIASLASEMKFKLHRLQSMYKVRQDALFKMKKNMIKANNKTPEDIAAIQTKVFGVAPNTVPPESARIVKEISGMAVAEGLKNIKEVQLPMVYHTLPHLLENPYSMIPSYHLRSKREFYDIVLGIPTVKRGKENYLLLTLTHVISGLAEDDVNTTLIVIFIGETNMTYVLNTARHIERRFPNEIEIGLIEIIAPDASFYPDLEKLIPNLGDSMKRMKWRTKQNLDTIYLTAYSYTRGSFYLMLEDDIVPKPGYLKAIKKYITDMTEVNPQWIVLEFCNIGGIGKLFRATDLPNFVLYVQLFYKNMPIDWLLESYLASRVCSYAFVGDKCQKQKLQARPRFTGSLFQHIGLYSSLEGKLQHVKDHRFGRLPVIYPHKNPELREIRSNLASYDGHTLISAYYGNNFFWGVKPKKGHYIEFWFTKPLFLQSYLFRSGSLERISAKFYYTVVDALPSRNNASYEMIGEFDEFGLAKGDIGKDFGLISAIRLRTLRNSVHWVVISEIHLQTYDPLEEVLNNRLPMALSNVSTKAKV